MTSYVYIVRDESTNAEVVPVKLSNVPADPTGGSIEFAFTSLTASPSSWTAGTWGTYDATADTVTANSPTVGSATATIDLSTASVWNCWVRYIVGGETIVRHIGKVSVF